MEDLSDRIRSARLAAGFDTAAQAARRLGMEPHAYRHYESGNRTPTSERFVELAKAFSVDLGWLMTGDGASNSEKAEITNIWDHILPEDREMAKRFLKSLTEKKA